ncbi:astacin [Cooperia oncophora]
MTNLAMFISSREYVPAENPGCFSTVGRDTSQPVQAVNIGRGCQHFGITSHEIAHCLGLFHHQQRYDRDTYITFHEEDVQFRYWLNFAKIPSKYLSTYGLPYDVGSVMHYTPTEFSESDYVYALTANNPNLQGTMGSMDEPSFLDVQIINRHYQCGDACNTTENLPRCLNGGYVNPKNCSVCKCPTGFAGDLCQLIASSAPIRCGGLIPTTSTLTKMRIRLTSVGPRRKCVYHIRASANL